MKIVIIIVDFMKNILMEFKSSGCFAIVCQFTNFVEKIIHTHRDHGQIPVRVSYYLKNSHFPHLLKRLDG